jgi:HPt (histidine-containing phosphotransfer) domain-containing protein
LCIGKCKFRDVLIRRNRTNGNKLLSNETIDQVAFRRLLEVIGGEKEDLRELLEEFEISTPILVEKMKTAAADLSLDSLRISAHSLKANGRDFGAMKLASLCELLERDCKLGDVSEPIGRVEEIGGELAVVRQELRKITQSYD